MIKRAVWPALLVAFSVSMGCPDPGDGDPTEVVSTPTDQSLDHTPTPTSQPGPTATPTSYTPSPTHTPDRSSTPTGTHALTPTHSATPSQSPRPTPSQTQTQTEGSVTPTPVVDTSTPTVEPDGFRCDTLPAAREVAVLSDCGVDLSVAILGLCEASCDDPSQLAIEISNVGSEGSIEGRVLTLFGLDSDRLFVELATAPIPALAPGRTTGGILVSLPAPSAMADYPAVAALIQGGPEIVGVSLDCSVGSSRAELALSHTSCPSAEICEDPGPAHSVGLNDQCRVLPDVGVFEPVVERIILPASNEKVLTVPVVGHLNDDNGDGLVGEGDVPDIVVSAYVSEDSAHIRAFRGDTGQEMWNVERGEVALAGVGGVALGDADADGLPEIYTMGQAGRLLAFARDGSPLWKCDTIAEAQTHPAIADVDGDGLGEILAGRSLCDHDGRLLFTTDLKHGWTSFLADMNLDGRMEIVSGAGISSTANGETLLTGFTYQEKNLGTAVANFDEDDAPEWVAVSKGYVYLYDDIVNNEATGTADSLEVWKRQFPPCPAGKSVPSRTTSADTPTPTEAPPSNRNNGPPTIADFDGDGELEIGAAGECYYAVWNADGTRLWAAPIQDNSSARTGSSVFDFDADGKPEVVYAGERNLWIFDGATGEVLTQMEEHESPTRNEYPVIADVDSDGKAEIVLASQGEVWNGIVILGDKNDNWATSREVWNQHAYHISNIADDMSLPSPLQTSESMKLYNSFRQGQFSSRGPTAAPDLLPEVRSACDSECPDRATFVLRIENQGADDVGAGVGWSIYAQSANGVRRSLVSGVVEKPIPAGWSSSGFQTSISTSAWSEGERLILVVDDPLTEARLHRECDEDNNEVELVPPCGAQ